MKKLFSALIAVMMLVSMSGCNLLDDDFEDTPETDAAFEAYEAAIRKSVAHQSGQIKVTTENTDTIEATETLGTIDYSYSTDDEGRVSFERIDHTDGKLVASYYGDGKAAFQKNLETGEWVDMTEGLASFLNAEENTMNSLALFRIDNDFSYSKRFYESIELKESDGEQVITVVLKNSEITEMMSYSDEREIQREMSSQIRSYYVNKEGSVYKIVIDSVQNVVYQGEKGVLSSLMTVDITY